MGRVCAFLQLFCLNCYWPSQTCKYNLFQHTLQLFHILVTYAIPLRRNIFHLTMFHPQKISIIHTSPLRVKIFPIFCKVCCCTIATNDVLALRCTMASNQLCNKIFSSNQKLLCQQLCQISSTNTFLLKVRMGKFGLFDNITKLLLALTNLKE